jgi:uncharacterized protein YndB with AHSA1/START domain
MSPIPTGRLRGNALVVTRTFTAPIDDVWASVTHPERTARWFGTWKGTPGPGGVIQFQMRFEQGEPWMDATIEVCDAPNRLVINSDGPHGMRLELALVQTGDTTQLELIQHAIDRAVVGDYGPGWEYYLDNLVAARADQPLPRFDSYYPAQKPYFTALAAEPRPRCHPARPTGDHRDATNRRARVTRA